MRTLSIILYGLAAIALCLWAGFYVFVISMACAFVSPNSSGCRTPMPWDLTGEDLNVLVIMPAVGVVALFVLAVVVGRLAKRDTP